MATTFDAGKATALAVAKGVRLLTPVARNSDLDITYDCLGYDSDGNPNQGVPVAYATASGTIPFVDFVTTAIAYASASGTLILGSVMSDNTATAYASASADLILRGGDLQNWVKWSDIGNLDFTIDHSNTAGEMPMDWKGFVYDIRKLGSKVIVYGENGISMLEPIEERFGLNTIHRIGLKGRDASAGTDFVHFFVDSKGRLYQLDETLKELDYSEYLSVMTNPVLSYDGAEEVLYICDGTYGFAYSPKDQSMGSGPVNITGIGSRGGALYVAAPAAITTPTFEICTDIFDFGTRKVKSVYQLEFGTNLTGVFQAAVEYRRDFKGAFTSTPWKAVHEKSNVKIICKGTEFRFKAKISAYEYFELDYFIINGHYHVH